MKGIWPYSDPAIYWLPGPGGGGGGRGSESPLYSFKTAYDTATKITQSNVLIFSNI